jgi:hypothetical protein
MCDDDHFAVMVAPLKRMMGKQSGTAALQVWPVLGRGRDYLCVRGWIDLSATMVTKGVVPTNNGQRSSWIHKDLYMGYSLQYWCIRHSCTPS